MATKKYEKICNRCGVEAELLDDRIERGWIKSRLSREERVPWLRWHPAPVRSVPRLPLVVDHMVSRATAGARRAARRRRHARAADARAARDQAARRARAAEAAHR